MNEGDALEALERAGTAQNRKVYARHGVLTPMYGVSYANLEKLRQQVKVDHELALKLWQSGNHDARILATMIADPAQLTAATINTWSRDLSNYVLTDAMTGLVARTQACRQKDGTVDEVVQRVAGRRRLVAAGPRVS